VSKDARAVVVGGGPVGCVLAALLAGRGHEVTVYEKRPDMRRGDAPAGRSINLVLTRRGLRALELLGLREKVLKLTVPVLGRMMHAHDGALTYQPYGKDDSERNHSVSRGQLNQFLLDEAEAAGVRLVFDREVAEADPDAGTLTVRSTQDGSLETVAAPRLFGADGAPSAVRRALVQREGYEDSMDMLGHGYKELLFPAAADGGYAMEQSALHIWPRGSHMLMGLPNLDGSFTGTLYLANEGDDSFASLDEEAKVEAFFQREYPDAIPLLSPDYARELLENPTGLLGTVRTNRWDLDDRVLLVGDAAHAIVPFFGQGLNCGFEDCAELLRLLDAHPGDLQGAFAAFSTARKTNADAIADMALENFVEMRDKVGDPEFLRKKRLESAVERALPGKYRSRYATVMYSSNPYRDAYDMGRVQEELLAELLAETDDPEAVDLARAEALIDAKLTPFVQERGIDLGF
jgi:kynurenine 3-monooxygenase